MPVPEPPSNPSVKPSVKPSVQPSVQPSVAPPTTVAGIRIVASPAALDGVTWPAGTTVLRFAPDDVFVIGDEPGRLGVDSVNDPHAIVAAESGFVGCWLNADQLAHVVEHVDWSLPIERPVLAQGFVAGVPAKLYLIGHRGETNGDLDQALLLTNAPYAADLWERLS